MQGGSDGAMYRYRGPDGRIVVVDSLSEVPEAQRPQAERLEYAEQRTPFVTAARDWRLDWPSAGLGFGVAILLGIALMASRRGSRAVLGIALVLVLMVAGTGLYLGMIRKSTGQGDSPLASPSALIDDARRAVDQAQQRRREQDQVIREIQREAR
jgi:hypothetical protein